MGLKRFNPKKWNRNVGVRFPFIQYMYIFTILLPFKQACKGQEKQGSFTYKQYFFTKNIFSNAHLSFIFQIPVKNLQYVI